MDISSTNDWNIDRESDKTITEWNLNKSIDQVKRFQLDYFAKRIGIVKYFPLDVAGNVDISEMYI